MMRFPSKVDTWIVAVLLLAPAIVVAVSIVTSDSALLLPLVAVTVIPVALSWPTDYTFEAEELVIRSGFFRWRVRYTEIDKVEPTTNCLSSPALSLDRLRIAYGRKSILVSPTRRDEFLSELRARARLIVADANETFVRMVNS